MFKDKIVSLDNGVEYYIINELIRNNRVFVLGAQVDTKNDTIDKDNLLIKEVVVENGSAKYITIDNPIELESISKELILKAHNEAL